MSFTISTWFGGDGGEFFQFGDASGAPLVSKIEFWERPVGGDYPQGCMAAIRITKSDGTISPMYGSTDSRTSRREISFELGERVTSCYLYTADHTPTGKFVVGLVKITTNRGQVFQTGGKPGKWGTVNVVHGSGMLAGIRGRAGADIDTLGFDWVSDLEEISLTMNYLTLPDPSTIQSIQYAQLDGDNRESDQPLQATISKSVTTMNSQTHTEGWSETVGVKTSFKFSIMKVVENNTEISFSATHTSSDSSTHSESHTLTWSGAMSIPPRQRYLIDLIYYEASYTIDYETEVTFLCKNGAQRSWKKPGKCVGTTAGITKIKPHRLARDIDVEVKKIPQEEWVRELKEL